MRGREGRKDRGEDGESPRAAALGTPRVGGPIPAGVRPIKVSLVWWQEVLKLSLPVPPLAPVCHGQDLEVVSPQGDKNLSLKPGHQ